MSTEQSEIRFTRIWSDDDVLELGISVCDGHSKFVVDCYVGINWPFEIRESLRVFRTRVHGGLLDLKAGEFGLEYANGAFSARLHFKAPGVLYVSTNQQSDHFEFKGNKVTTEARFYLRSEPILLDRFMGEVGALENSNGRVAILTCISK